MPELEIQPFSDDHVEPAAELLSERHRRHREVEPLLPELDDPVAAVESEWGLDDATGVFASRGGTPVGYLVAAPATVGPATALRVGVAGQAIEGEREAMRDIYAAAGQRWFDDGHSRQYVFVPSFDTELVDAWFRLCFGSSGALAMRETGSDDDVEADVTIRPGTREDFAEGVWFELAMSEAMQPVPSFSGLALQSYEEVLAEWLEDDFDKYELFVAERDGRGDCLHPAPVRGHRPQLPQRGDAQARRAEPCRGGPDR